MESEEELQREMLERFVAGNATLPQVLDASGIDRTHLARWLADKRFRKMLADAKERWRLLQKMELMLQQSVATQKRTEMLRDEQNLDAKTIETTIRQTNQQLAQIHREQRDRRRDAAKRLAMSSPYPRIHPSVDEKTADRLFAEMDRVDRFYG
jgi:hypothetical protein